jgi:hypothetical protein
MIAVAVVGLLTGVGVGLVRRRSAFQQRAAAYARASNQEALSGMYIERRYHWGPAEPEKPVIAAHYRRSDHFAALRAKYERAARFPWLPMPPDPPTPLVPPFAD